LRRAATTLTRDARFRATLLYGCTCTPTDCARVPPLLLSRRGSLAALLIMRAAILTCLGFSPVASVTTTHELCGAVHELRDKLHELCDGASAADERTEFMDMKTGLKVQTTVPYQAVGYNQHVAVNVKYVAQMGVPEPVPGIDHRARKLQSACAPGTTASYADETLAFRFRSEDMTTDANGLRWNAVVPPGLAFTMVRPPDPVADSTGGWYSGENSANATEPSTTAPPGVAEGIHFESGSGATYGQMMVSNQKVAVGASNTFFAMVTPASTAAVFSGLLAFRPGEAPGVFGWVMGTSGCPNTGAGEINEGAVGCIFVDDWDPSGFFGPAFQGDVMQIAIWRSRLTHNAVVRWATFSTAFGLT
jgi:hypothetical protein